MVAASWVYTATGRLLATSRAKCDVAESTGYRLPICLQRPSFLPSKNPVSNGSPSRGEGRGGYDVAPPEQDEQASEWADASKCEMKRLADGTKVVP